MSESEQLQGNTEKIYHISHNDLPLSCPMPSMRIWDSHPRVYLPVDETGDEICPYCGARFILDDFGGATEEKHND